MNQSSTAMKIGCCIVLLSASVFNPVQADNMTLKVGSVTGTAGTEIEVPINVTQAIRLGALQMDVRFDDRVLEFRSARARPFEDPITIDQNVVEPGRLRMVMNSSASASISGDHELLTLKFLVIGSVGSQTEVTLEAIEAWDNIGPDAIPAVMLVTAESGNFVAADDAGGQTITLLFVGLVVLLVIVVAILITGRLKGKSSGSGN